MKAIRALNGTDIDRTVSEAEQFVQKAGMKPSSCLRFRLSLEEILIICRERLGSETSFVLRMKNSSGDIKVDLVIKGPEADPFSEESPILRRVLQDFDGIPSWKYEDGNNHIRYVLPVYNTLRKNMKLSWKYMKGQRKTFILAVICQLAGIGFKIAAPVLSAQIIVGLTNDVFEQILFTALALLGVQVLSELVMYIANRGYNIVYNKTLSNLEEELVDAVMQISNYCLEEKGTGLFIQRLTSDTTSLATGFNIIADLLSQLCNYIGIMIAILVVSPLVFLLVLIIMTVLTLIELARTRRIKIDDRQYRNANERFTGFVSEMVKGAKDVKLLGSEETFKRELTERITITNEKRMNMKGTTWKFKLFRGEVGNAGFFVLIIILALLITKGNMEPVTAVVLFNYYSSLGTPAVLLLGELLEFIKDFNLSAERAYALLSSLEFPKEQFGSTHLDSLQGEIRFDHVEFAYKQSDPSIEPRRILKNLSFQIPAHSTVAFVGKSGCGKTTTLNLMSKLYDATGGSVLLDNCNIQMLDRETIRSNIAVVSQNPYIFNLTVRENLQLVKPDLTEEEMQRVCRLACIEEDIAQMPKGYDTLIGEGGTNLSGGQRQRLAIARALLRDFRILLLDEATSALDNITQAKIKNAIDNLCEGHTVILVAHRLSTIVDVDKIMFIEDGKLLDEGTHSELMQRCGPYRELYGTETGSVSPEKYFPSPRGDIDAPRRDPACLRRP